ncbi:MAG TPA: tetratricopeptide repeat protein [Caulobacteraceae bacterium]|nr:tetratricopeptide repeat protein [Caulobacteraceae bacterium]
MLVAGVALCGCTQATQQTPDWLVCKQGGVDQASLERRAQACSALIHGEASRAEDLALAYRLHGEALRLSGAPDSALQEEDRAIGLNAADPLAYDERGMDELSLRRLDAAAADFGTAIRLDPRGAVGFDGRGAIERMRGDLAGAFRDADRAIELKPDWADPWGQRGLAYLANRRFDMALADFAQALRIDATQAFAIEGAAAAEAAKGDIKAATADYGRAQEVHIERRQYPAAIAVANKMVALAPNDPDALNARCWARAIADTDLDAALADCQQSLKLRPGSAEVLDSRAFVAFRQGRWRAAIQDYSAALAKNPKLSSSLYMRGVAKMRAGDSADGQADVNAATSADSDIADQYASYGVTP